MENLKNNVIISLIMVFVAMIIFAGTVNASSSFIFGNDTNSENEEVTVAPVKTNTTVKNTTSNTVIVNNINDNASKDLPKTGETDTYIIATVGVIAIAVGGIAYIISKKYNM